MASKFQKIRSVTLNVIKLVPGQPRYLAFLGAMHVGKQIDDAKEPATLARVVDLDTGEEGQIICPTVLQQEMRGAYEGDSYVGKAFEIVTTKVPEKRYNLVSISEIAIPDEMQAAVTSLLRVAQGRAGVAAAAPVKAVAGKR
jgi:hypothetical protein